MSKMDIMFMSKSNEWATPQDFFDELNKEFNFNLDPCSDDTNYKCEKHYTQADDGLSQDWGGTESFAILHMARKLANGLRKHLERGTKTILL